MSLHNHNAKANFVNKPKIELKQAAPSRVTLKDVMPEIQPAAPVPTMIANKAGAPISVNVQDLADLLPPGFLPCDNRRNGGSAINRLVFCYTTPASGKPKFCLRMGLNLLLDLDWEVGINVNIFYNKENPTIFFAMPHPNGNKLQKETGASKTAKVTVTSFITFNQPTIDSTELDYEIVQVGNVKALKATIKLGE